MKKIILFALLVCSGFIKSQITLDHIYTTPERRALTKFGLKGYKYTCTDGNGTFQIYNLNNTLFRSFTIPSYSYSTTNVNIPYLSDNLFNSDTLIEYVVWRGSGSIYKLIVYNELGNVVFSRDSAFCTNMISGSANIPALANYGFIYFDGSAVKMHFTKYLPGNTSRNEIYTLPGSLPCSECTSGFVTGLAPTTGNEVQQALFFPNPVQDQLKLKYTVPADSKNAGIKIYDLTGKLIEDFRISPTQDYILLPSDYNNGLYIYSLTVDGKVIKNEKVILNK